MRRLARKVTFTDSGQCSGQISYTRSESVNLALRLNLRIFRGTSGLKIYTTDTHWAPISKSPTETQKNSSHAISENFGFEDISATVSYQQRHAILTPTQQSTTMGTTELTSTQSTLLDMIDSESVLENSASGSRFPDFEVQPDHRNCYRNRYRNRCRRLRLGFGADGPGFE